MVDEHERRGVCIIMITIAITRVLLVPKQILVVLVRFRYDYFPTFETSKAIHITKEIDHEIYYT